MQIAGTHSRGSGSIDAGKALRVHICYRFPHTLVRAGCYCKQQKFIFSQLWRVRVQDQGAGRAALFEASLLALRMTNKVSPLRVHSSGDTLCIQISSPYKDTSQIGLGPILIASFNLIISLKALLPHIVTLLRCWEIGLQHLHFQETQFSP